MTPAIVMIRTGIQVAPYIRMITKKIIAERNSTCCWKLNFLLMDLMRDVLDVESPFGDDTADTPDMIELLDIFRSSPPNSILRRTSLFLKVTLRRLSFLLDVTISMKMLT